MHYIGNVSPGSAEYVEFDVIPNMEGMAKCILKITFEDSNGDEVEYIKEFEQMVNSPMVWDPGMDQGVMKMCLILPCLKLRRKFFLCGCL